MGRLNIVEEDGNADDPKGAVKVADRSTVTQVQA
jgi:hypothetical protein